MGVTTEELNGDVPLLFSYRLEDTGKLFAAERDMAVYEEEVYFPVSYSFLEPLLLDGVLDLVDNGVVGVAHEVEKKAKS